MKKDWRGRLIEVCPGWLNAGRRGAALAEPISIKGQEWLPVMWFGSDDPDFHKMAGIRMVDETDKSFGLPRSDKR